MNRSSFRAEIEVLTHGKRLPEAVYVAWPTSEISRALAETVKRAEAAARPAPGWNLLKLHRNQFAVTFLCYPDFDTDPHPALASATRINLGTGSVVTTDYRGRANAPILHRKETFIPNSDPRKAIFAGLTAEEEQAGLLKDTAQIGHPAFWQELLRRKNLHFEGHRLVQTQHENENGREREKQTEIVARHRTAIKRYDLSRPVKLLLEAGLLRKNDTFFDYGCGHGMDIEALRGLGYTAKGWDPVFRPKDLKEPSAVVNLGYVLNVIEEPDERIATLKNAFSLAERLLAVSTMVTGRETQAHSRPYRDGFLTKTNTFQKFFAPGELEALIEEYLGVEAITVGIGICIAFRNPDDAELFEAIKNRRRIDWSEISNQLRFATPTSRQARSVSRYELHKKLLDDFWKTLLELGRLPEPGEYERLNEVKRAAGGLKRALALTVTQRGEGLWQVARKARNEDTLVYLAMTNFRKRILRREIPLRIKHDSKAFFGDLAAAQTKGRELLFAAGDPDEIALAIQEMDFGVYNKREEQFTFHRSFFDKLPPILRVYVLCAAIRYGSPGDMDLIKIHVRSGKVTFLIYKDFDSDPAPALLTRIKINLRNRFVEVFDHSTSDQRLENKQDYVRGTQKPEREKRK